MSDTTNKLIEVMFKVSRFMKSMHYKSPLVNLSMIQLQALIFLKHNPSAQMSDIATHFRIELPSATSLVNKLHEMELVERQTDDKDRRLVRIDLTNTGQTLLKDAMIERNKKIETLLSYVAESDKDELLRI